jgi:hypothetical protein
MPPCLGLSGLVFLLVCASRTLTCAADVRTANRRYSLEPPCKARRQKLYHTHLPQPQCDDQWPICSNCQKAGTPCDKTAVTEDEPPAAYGPPLRGCATGTCD